MKKLFALLMASLLTCSCEPDSAEVGSDFFTDGVLDFSYIDSATVKLSTIQLPEMATNTTNRILLGTHMDEKLGRLTATPFFQVTPTTEIDLKDQNVAYDYLSLLLPLDHYSYYDTLTSLTLSVHSVTEDITAVDSYIYSSTTFAMASESLGSVTFNPRPYHDSVEIKLSDVLGKEIFDKAVSGGDDLTSTKFVKFIRGFAIVSETTDAGCFLGLTTNPKLKLHYIDKSTTPISEKFEAFDVQTGSSLYFTRIAADRNNTVLENMPSVKSKLSETYTDGVAFLQAGAGLSLRVDLPYLRSLKLLNNFYPTQAILDIYPMQNSTGPGTKFPQQLTVFAVDKRNTIYKEIETPAQLVEDIDLGRDTHYSFDATEFVKDQMELQSLNENALIFTTDRSTYPVSADRIYAAAPSYQYKTRLRIYFVTVNN